MKKLFLLALMAVGITTFAQEKGEGRKERLTQEQRVDLQVKKLTTDLSLNENQVKQVRELVTNQAEKREAKRAEKDAKKLDGQKLSNEDKEGMKTKMQEEQKATKAEMKKILTAEQYAKWEQKMNEKKEKMVNKMRDRNKGLDKTEDK